ncbi:hypothetical protein [Xenorhabdus thuongxuanensis]|uniref:Uncharacterized protein n=1 Tax=Xenorhabdus thuongxuanensis TaxID=1873484 RepID=A0A1Q5TYW8_9GAMM|nr:hypothetical protein [Xenorhabdus thuongxuanensis]OKP05429.1 hypothetical protein Xentx_02468 [Xenorhabdus thuongxuanensis]
MNLISAPPVARKIEPALTDSLPFTVCLLLPPDLPFLFSDIRLISVILVFMATSAYFFG